MEALNKFKIPIESIKNIENLIGKYVCIDLNTGETKGACFGKIVRNTQINTIDGAKDAFVVVDRRSYQGSGKVITHWGETLILTEVVDFVLDLDIEKDFSEEEIDYLFVELLSWNDSKKTAIAIGIGENGLRELLNKVMN